MPNWLTSPSGSLFSPTIIAALGKWTTAQSLLLSVPRENAVIHHTCAS